MNHDSATAKFWMKYPIVRNFLLFSLIFFFLTAELSDCNGDDFDGGALADAVAVQITSNTFVDDDIAAEPGQIVTFYNLDSIVHHILSESAEDAFDDSGDFDSGPIAAGSFGFINVPEDAQIGDTFFFYDGILTDAMATPNGVITVR